MNKRGFAECDRQVHDSHQELKKIAFVRSESRRCSKLFSSAFGKFGSVQEFGGPQPFVELLLMSLAAPSPQTIVYDCELSDSLPGEGGPSAICRMA
jgi:hypothetical protein